MRTTFAAATELARSLLEHAGMPAEPAWRTSWALCLADAWGRGSHGLMRLPFYLSRLSSGGANPAATLDVVNDLGATVALDGGNGLGHWQVWEAAGAAARRARQHGIAAVSVSNSGHCGALGIYALPIVEAGLAGMVFSHGPAVIPPWGGNRPVTSTSPLAFGFPLEGRPLVVDLACSAVARGRIAEAAAAGEPLPDGWALDAEGRPTNDASAALAGMLAPLGGAKGFALALAVEGLTAGLVGPSLSTQVADPLDPSAAGRPQRIAHLVIALAPEALDGDGGSRRRLALLAESVRAAGGRLPGEAHPLPEEIPDDFELSIPDKLAASLGQQASACGLSLPGGWDQAPTS